MNRQQAIVALAALLGALGMWLMLPRGAARGRRLGALLGMVGLGLFVSRLPGLGDWLAATAWYVLAGVTVVAAVATVTFRNPVYCAVWFAVSLLGTSGLFLIQGAQFLGVATIVVYAGAILVMFLFVLMLAQPSGNAFYDRLSWESLLASCTGAAMVGLLALVIGSTLASPGEAGFRPPASEAARRKELTADEHVAHLGRELFGARLMEVELAGTLLLVALVGCVAIIARGQVEAHGSGGPRP